MKTAYYTESKKVDSSNLSEVFYDDGDKTMYVKFHSGSIAGYRDVPYTDFRQLASAVSPGRYYNSFVKGKFRGLNGDVWLAKRPTQQPTTTNTGIVAYKETSPLQKYEVEIETVLRRTIKVDASSFDSAASKAVGTLSTTADTKVLSVKRV